jgi:hypothetical protein
MQEVPMAHTPTIVPILSAGRHRTPRQGACFMEFASYLAGERWSDHPACTHPVLASIARDVNDLTSDAARARLLPHVHRVIGLRVAERSGDERLGAILAMRAAAVALPVASMERQNGLAVGMLGILRSYPELLPVATAAFANAPDAERWARRYLETWPGRRPLGEHAALAIAHTAAMGIALACVDDVDARLESLLAQSITVAEAVVRPAARTERTAAPALL